MNTAFHYLYRDASNYKQHGKVVFGGEPENLERAFERLRDACEDRQWFIAEQLDLPNLREEWESHYDDDHIWHEIDRLDLTEALPTDDRTIDEFIEQFVSAGERWDEESALRNLDQWLAETPRGKP